MFALLLRVLVVTGGSADPVHRTTYMYKWLTVNTFISPHYVVDFVVKELRRYGVSIAGMQEIRWFGSNV